MNIQSIKSLMEINALQTLGAVQTVADSSSSSSMFNELLVDLLQSSSISDSVSSSTTNILNDLQYSGDHPIFVPSSLPAQNAVQHYSNSTEKGFTEIIKAAANTYNLPEKLIESIIQQESSFDSQAVSGSGAAGLMQLMPGTAQFLGVTDRFDPYQNIMGGAKYLRQMLNQFDDQIDIALAAYNAGPGNVRKYDGIPPFKETEQYVQKVLTNYQA